MVTLDVKQPVLGLELQHNLQVDIFKNTFKILIYVFNKVLFVMCTFSPKQYAVTVTVNCWSICCSFDAVPGVVKCQLSFLYFSGMWGAFVAENEQGWKLWIKYSLVLIIQNGIQQVNVPNTVFSTIHYAYGKQTCSIPTQCHVCTNIHCYPFSLL